jgi:hypothetical protein
MHAYDDEGRLRPYRDLPKTVAGLIDDPFRRRKKSAHKNSLNGVVSLANPPARRSSPANERVKRKTVETHFEDALAQALELAKKEEASYLPGWCGPVLED